MKRLPLCFAAAAILCLASSALAARKPAREERPKLPALAVLSFPASSGAWGCGTWQNHEAAMSDRLRDLFTTEVQSRAGGALRLVERHRMADLKEELALQRSDDVDAATRVKSGKLAGARYMLTGKITRFACKAMGFHSGWGVGRIVGRVTGDGLAGAIAGSVDVRRVSFTGRLDARLIDVETGEVLATFKDEDASGDFSVKVAGGGAEVEYDEELFARVFEPLVERMAARVVSKTVEAVHGGEDAGE